MNDEKINDSLNAYAQKGFLRDLLLNNISNAKDVISLKKLLDIQVNINTVFVLTIDNYYSLTFNKSELQKQHLRLNVLQALEKIASEMNIYVLNMAEEVFAILLRTEQGGVLDLRKCMKIGKIIVDKVRDSTGVVVSLGVGRPYRDILNIHLSYREALAACSNKFFSPGGPVIHVSQVVPYSEDLGIFSEEIESELTVKILSCNENEAFRIIEELLTKTSRLSSLNPLLLKTRLIEITTLLIKVALETGANSEKLSEISADTVRILLQSDTLSELARAMEKAIGDITREIFLTRKRKNLTAFDNSLQYIHENFHREVSLEEVANHVHLNIYYFSHGFKSFTGMSFIDYLTKVRIEEAKKLLLAGKSIGEVAKKVGYLNTNYFGRVFKNMVGVPPSKYKVQGADTTG